MSYFSRAGRLAARPFGCGCGWGRCEFPDRGAGPTDDAPVSRSEVQPTDRPTGHLVDQLGVLLAWSVEVILAPFAQSDDDVKEAAPLLRKNVFMITGAVGSGCKFQ